MDKQDTLRKIKEFNIMGTILSVNLIESEARKIMSSHDDLYEFVMGMGTCCFVDNNKQTLGITYSQLDDDMVEFFEMVDDLDCTWNIMGHPMRFTVDGPKRIQW